MNWPRGEIEQELFIRRIEDQVSRLRDVRRSIVIHSYFQPTRQQWEARYAAKYGGTPPIPPGMRLCWYDMRNGSVSMYTTTFDRSGGTVSSGEVYKSTANVISNAIRFLGTYRSDGRIAPADINSPDVVVGSNIAYHKRKGLQMLDMFFAIDVDYVNDTVKLMIDFGDNVIEPEFVATTVDDFVRIQGIPFTETTAIDDSSSRTNVLVELQELADAANSAAYFPAPFFHVRIVNPFSQVKDEVERPLAPMVVVGTAYSPRNNFGNLSNGVHVAYFAATRFHSARLGKDWRITLHEGTSENRITPVDAYGYVYGYYNVDTNLSSKEFEGVI